MSAPELEDTPDDVACVDCGFLHDDDTCPTDDSWADDVHADRADRADCSWADAL